MVVMVYWVVVRVDDLLILDKRVFGSTMSKNGSDVDGFISGM